MNPPKKPREWRYMTLAEARAVECNGCGDCCDSRRTDYHFGWGKIPTSQYASYNGGLPLIQPIGGPGDTCGKFRCAVFVDDGDTGRCGLHDKRRPKLCGTFPVFGTDVADLLDDGMPVRLKTEQLRRCTWYAVIVVRDDWPLLAKRKADCTVSWERLTRRQRLVLSATRGGD